jgi:WD40 repeat protein
MIPQISAPVPLLSPTSHDSPNKRACPPFVPRCVFALAFVLCLTSRSFSADVSGAYEHASPVAGATLSPDGKHLATRCLDGSVHIWETPNRHKMLIGRSDEKNHSYALQFAPNSQLLCMFRPGELSIRIWKLNGDRWDELRAARFGLPGAIGYASAAFAPDSRAIYASFAAVTPPAPGQEEDESLLVAPTTVAKVDIASPHPNSKTLPVREKFLGLDLLSLYPGVSHDEKTLFLSGWDKIMFFDPDTGKRQQVLQVDGASSLEFSSDGKYLCTCSTREVMIPEFDVKTTVRTWKKRNGHYVEVSRPLTVKGVYATAFAPDSQHLIVAEKQCGLRSFHVPGNKIALTMKLAHVPRQLVFVDAKTLLAVGFDFPQGKTAVVWRQSLGKKGGGGGERGTGALIDGGISDGYGRPLFRSPERPPTSHDSANKRACPPFIRFLPGL